MDLDWHKCTEPSSCSVTQFLLCKQVAAMRQEVLPSINTALDLYVLNAELQQAVQLGLNKLIILMEGT